GAGAASAPPVPGVTVSPGVGSALLFPGSSARPPEAAAGPAACPGSSRRRPTPPGMVSRKLLAAITEAGLEYIVGLPLRRHREAEAILSHPGRYRVVGEQLRIKHIARRGVRYVLCYNPVRAEHDRRAREAVLDHLQQRIAHGEGKQLLKNRLVARYLETLPEGALAVDEGAVARAARYDG